jgi:hypothetical protein
MNALLDQGYTVIPSAVHGARAALLRERLHQRLPEPGTANQIVVPRLVELDDDFAATAENGPHLPLLLDLSSAHGFECFMIRGVGWGRR